MFEYRSRGTKALQTLRDLGPLFVGLANLILTATIAFVAAGINSRQAQISEATFRDKLVSQLTGDDKQRASGAVSLALYGAESWPTVVRMMGVDLYEVRESVSQAVGYVFMAGLVPRQTVLRDLLRATADNSPALRKSAWRSLRGLAESSLLTESEANEVIAQFRSRMVLNAEPDSFVRDQAFDTTVALAAKYPDLATVICEAAGQSARTEGLKSKAEIVIKGQKLQCPH